MFFLPSLPIDFNRVSSMLRVLSILNSVDTSLKLIGIEGRKNIIKKFNVEKMCFSTYSEYKKLIN